MAADSAAACLADAEAEADAGNKDMEESGARMIPAAAAAADELLRTADDGSRADEGKTPAPVPVPDEEEDEV